MLTHTDNTYGEPTIKILAPCYSTYSQSSSLEDVSNYVLVFEPLEKISLKGKIYDFSQLTGYSISINPVDSSTTKTSLGSALGRAALGSAIFGGVGALIGASTAKTETEYKSKTTFTVFTNSLSEPAIILDLILPEKENVARIEGVLKIITAKNTSSGQKQDTPQIKKLGIGDFATIKKDKREVIIIDIKEEDGKILYECLEDDETNYYSEEELD